MRKESEAVPRLLYTPEAAAARLDMGRTMIYSKIASGEIESVKIGRLRRIPEAALVSYVKRLRDEQANETSRHG